MATLGWSYVGEESLVLRIGETSILGPTREHRFIVTRIETTTLRRANSIIPGDFSADGYPVGHSDVLEFLPRLRRVAGGGSGTVSDYLPD